jgi:hypothetical protein
VTLASDFAGGASATISAGGGSVNITNSTVSLYAESAEFADAAIGAAYGVTINNSIVTTTALPGGTYVGYSSISTDPAKPFTVSGANTVVTNNVVCKSNPVDESCNPWAGTVVPTLADGLVFWKDGVQMTNTALTDFTIAFGETAQFQIKAAPTSNDDDDENSGGLASPKTGYAPTSDNSSASTEFAVITALALTAIAATTGFVLRRKASLKK